MNFTRPRPAPAIHVLYIGQHNDIFQWCELAPKVYLVRSLQSITF